MSTKNIQKHTESPLKATLPQFELVHAPVLLQEIVELLPLTRGATVIDATLGLGGHSQEILKKIGPTGHLIGFDWDQRNREIARENLSDFPNKTIIAAGFSHLEEESHRHGIEKVDAILFDIGISSAHLDDASRGFSYRKEGPLDMRMDTTKEICAADLVHGLPEEELAHIIWKYGEERQSRKIAKAIVERRKKESIRTTEALYQILEETCPKNPKKVASRVFQALRIAVNGELKQLESALPQALRLLKDGGRVAVISFHSLEDRIVKNFFRDTEKKGKIGKKKSWQRVNKKVIIPRDVEIVSNPRSRSAKLRILEKSLPQ